MRKPAIELARRFYKAVDVQGADDGFAVRLDGRTPRSPRGKPLVLPTQALATLVAEEWAAQREVIRLAQMRATRLAYTALDAVPPARRETAGEIASYAGSDVLCYRAPHPRSAVAAQAAAWDPWLEWAREDLGVLLKTTSGIVHIAQDPEALERIRSLAAAESDMGLAGLAFATALFGSAVLAIAVQRGRLEGGDAFEISRLDQRLQEEQWGVDEEERLRTEQLRLDAAMVGGWFASLT